MLMNRSQPQPSAAAVMAKLGLQSLDQEGGYFRRTAESGVWVKKVEGVADATRAYSVIYALFTAEAFSAMHRLTTDEIWCWHAGAPIESLRLHPDGRGEWVRLGGDVLADEKPQDVIAAGVWQGTRLVAGGEWALVSCVMAPEFRWQDFELGERDALIASYPGFGDGIKALTRDEAVRGEL